MSQTHDDVVADLSNAVAKAAHRLNVNAKAAAHDAKYALGDARESFDRASREFAHDARELAHDASEQSRRAAILARREIRQHPMAAVAIGAAVGAIIGLLTAPRPRH